MTLAELATLVGGQLLQSNDLRFSRICTDSRTLDEPSVSVFFAFSGVQHDGHDFISDLYQKGVRLFVVEKDMPPASFDGAAIVKVRSCLQALQAYAAHHRQNFEYPVVGITGSNGKTIVKEWLSTLCGGQYHVVKSPKSYNSQLGVPLSVVPMSSSYDLGVFEAGISTTGQMKALEKIIQPTIGIFTNLGPAHDQGFSSAEEKLAEKSLLFTSCQEIVCCHDHEKIIHYLSRLQEADLCTWSLENPEAGVYFQLEGQQLKFTFRSQEYQLRLPFTEQPHLENLLHAITASLLLGVTEQQLRNTLGQIRLLDMRLILKPGKNQCYLLDDTYNNDLAGIRVALNVFSQQKQKPKRTVILSDILQSTIAPEKLYKEVNQLLIEHDIHQLIGIGPQISQASDVFSLPIKTFSDIHQYLSAPHYFEDEMILIKGARNFELERIVASLESKSHRTELVVDFESLLDNFKTYRRLLAEETQMMIMVKAFAYGGGSYEIANLLQYHGADYLAVAYIDEGIALRQHGIHLPIMVMNPDWDSLLLLEKYELEPEIYSLEMLRFYMELGLSQPIHLKIESGMNRLGFQSEDLEEMVSLLRDSEWKVQSIFTHFSSSDSEEEDDFTRSQAAVFTKAYDYLASALGYSPMKHALNSPGMVRWPEYHYDMVRLGIGLYGVDPTNQLDLKVVSTLRTKVSQIKKVKTGQTVGYSRKGVVTRDSTIAILPIGYADGYLRAYGNGKAQVSINGRLAFTLGNICMDMTMVDVTDLQVKEGDEVILFGENPTLEQLARWADTIPYETLTNVGQRVKRIYSWN